MNHNRGSVTPNLPTIVSVEQINTCGSGPRAVDIQRLATLPA
jgi:hypothetical protein